MSAAFPEMAWARTLQHAIDAQVNAWVEQHADRLEAMTRPLLHALLQVEHGLLALPWWLVLLLVSLAGWHAGRRLRTGLALGGLMALPGLLGYWQECMQTLALMLMATLLAVLIGIPLGMLMARIDRVRSLLHPLLDIMQTMPGFVYLIPVVMLFGLGTLPALMATVIYALPPLVRLTDLGLRQVDREVMEAARAFGASPRQQLFGVQLPLAWPSILAGINQTTMLALSMVVIASMIGARGLGQSVLIGINRLEAGRGLLAGLCVVTLAVVLDRLSQAYGRRGEGSARHG